MVISESHRHELHGRLIEALGPEAAATLMEYLPPVGWADVATRRDLDSLGHQLRGEMAELRGDLRGEMAELRSELRIEIAGIGRNLFFQMAGLQLSAAALVVAVSKLA